MEERKQIVVYVTRDIERASGMAPSPTYRIVSNRTSYGEEMRERYPEHVTLIDSGEGGVAGTGDLLDSPETSDLIGRLTASAGSRPGIMIFKNTARIEPIVAAHGWSLLNPSAALSEKVENKVSQVAWLGELGQFLPDHRIETMRNVAWTGTPFVLQWAHGHTGGGTMLVTGPDAIADLKARFPERRCRITAYVEGPSFTVNVVVTPDRIAGSSISYQITGMKPFTESAFATVGNDWALAHKLLSGEDVKAVDSMAEAIGGQMQKAGWRGLFGIDIIKETATGRIWLIEINARQPASAAFESELQAARRAEGAPEAADGITTFEAHVAALRGEPVTKPLIPVTDGAQIVQRITSRMKALPSDLRGTLELAGFKAIPYDNTGENADLIRIQSASGIMESHDKLNQAGSDIASALS